MKSRRTGGDPGGLRDVPVVDDGGGAAVEGRPVCGRDAEGTSSVATGSSSGVTQELGGGPPPKSEETPNLTADSAVSEWTDEKHSSYLSSMEASFIRQLHNRECFSAHLLNWLSKERKQLNQRPAHSTTGSAPSSQFKVLQEGCWQKINFDGTSARPHAAKGTWEFFTNPSIQHFTAASSSKMHRVTSSELPGKASEVGKRKYSEWIGGLSSSSKTSVKQIPIDRSHVHVYKNCGNNAEVSDQNFSDEEDKDKSSVRGSRMKRLQMGNVRPLAVDQVVPLVRSVNSDDEPTFATTKDCLGVDQESGD